MFTPNREITVQEEGGPQDLLGISLDVVRKGIRSSSVLTGESKRNLNGAQDAGEGSIGLMNVIKEGHPREFPSDKQSKGPTSGPLRNLWGNPVACPSARKSIQYLDRATADSSELDLCSVIYII